MTEPHGETPGWEGSIGPFPGQYRISHVYARDIRSGAGNCVCGLGLGHDLHAQAAPGVPVPDRLRYHNRGQAGRGLEGAREAVRAVRGGDVPAQVQGWA